MPYGLTYLLPTTSASAATTATAKKCSPLYAQPDQLPVLAPLQEVLDIVASPQLKPTMAMRLGIKYKFSEAMGRHREQFADAAGLTRA